MDNQLPNQPVAPPTEPDKPTSSGQPSTSGAAVGGAPVMLTQAEKNDLRKKVLRGEGLTPDEAKQVIESLRVGSAAAIMASAEKKASKKGSKKGMSDEDLDSTLAEFDL